MYILVVLLRHAPKICAAQSQIILATQRLQTKWMKIPWSSNKLHRILCSVHVVRRALSSINTHVFKETFHGNQARRNINSKSQTRKTYQYRKIGAQSCRYSRYLLAMRNRACLVAAIRSRMLYSIIIVVSLSSRTRSIKLQRHSLLNQRNTKSSAPDYRQQLAKSTIARLPKANVSPFQLYHKLHTKSL